MLRVKKTKKFALVHYADNIYHVVKNEVVKKVHEAYSAPYQGKRYLCDLIVTLDDLAIAQSLKHCLQRCLPIIKIEKFNAGRNKGTEYYCNKNKEPEKDNFYREMESASLLDQSYNKTSEPVENDDIQEGYCTTEYNTELNHFDIMNLEFLNSEDILNEDLEELLKKPLPSYSDEESGIEIESNEIESENYAHDPDYVPEESNSDNYSEVDSCSPNNEESTTCTSHANPSLIIPQSLESTTCESKTESKSLESESKASKKRKKKNKLISNLNFPNLVTEPLGEAMKNPTKVTIEKSCGIPAFDEPKTYTCTFCKKKLVSKFIDHIKRKHKTEPEVERILRLPPAIKKKGSELNQKQLLRLKLINQLRGRGGAHNNRNAAVDQRIELPRRTRKDKPDKTLSDYKFCPFCSNPYVKSSYKKHLKACGDIEEIDGKESEIFNNIALGDIHEAANPYLRALCARMNSDEISKVARNDQLIVGWANLQAIKYRANVENYKQIRYDMRLLARILLYCRSENSNVKDFESLMHLDYKDLLIEAANALGKYDGELRRFLTPSTARDVGHIVSHVATYYRNLCIDSQDEKRKLHMNDFIARFAEMIDIIITTTVNESWTHKHIEQGNVELISGEDSLKFTKYIWLKRQESYEKLVDIIKNKKDFELRNNIKEVEQFSIEEMKVYKELGKATLLSVLTYNRRRPGEISRLRMSSYKFKKVVSSDTLKAFDKMSPLARSMASKYHQVQMRGKQNFKLTLALLDEKMVQSMDLIASCRKRANIPKNNPYVFALPKGELHDPYIKASDHIAAYARDSGASMPHLIRRTNLRKQAATAGVSLHLTDGQITNLSRFMGHDKEIHMNVYRQQVTARDILEVAQWLEYIQGGDEDMMSCEGLIPVPEAALQDTGDVEDNTLTEGNSDGVLANSVALKESRPNSKASNDVQESTNKGWSIECKELLSNLFSERYLQRITVSGSEIREAIKKHKCLAGKDVVNVRQFFQWDYKRRQKAGTAKPVKVATKRSRTTAEGEPLSSKRVKKETVTKKITPRNRLSPVIYKRFAKFIDDKNCPSLEECSKYYANTPAFAHLSPADIQMRVKQAISYNDSFESENIEID